MFPFQIDDVDGPTNEKLLSHFTGEGTGFCQVGPKKWILPSAYKQHAMDYYKTEIKSDDVWIVTYPRSGTTWCQELVWLINNNLNYEKAAATCLDTRFPFFEFGLLHHPKYHERLASLNNNDPNVLKVLARWREHGYELLPKLPSPRHIKTHLPFSLLPPNLTETCKVLYICRNPKDVTASYFHHNKLLNLHGYIGDFDQYWDYFEKNLLVYSPYFEHIKEGWSMRNNPNVLFLFYEDLIKDLPSAVRRVAAFLNKPLSDDELAALVKHLHIDNFRKVVMVHEDVPIQGIANPSAEGFFRQGKIGGNKEYSEEILNRADQWIKKNLEGTDLIFPTKQ